MSELWRQHLPALSGDPEAPLLRLLPGWAAGADHWRPFLPWLRRRLAVELIDLPGFGRNAHIDAPHLEHLLQRLAPPAGRPSVLVGWSLGGMLAAELAARHPGRVAALVTLASNARFVAENDWPVALPPGDFESFAAAAGRDAFWRRFSALQARGCDHERTLLRQLRELGPAPATAVARLRGLEWLRELDTRRSLGARPSLHLFGDHDALVPSGAAAAVAKLDPQAQVLRVPGASHAPFLSHAEHCAQALEGFLENAGLLRCAPPRARDKAGVAASFGAAAHSYNAAALLQRDVGTALLQDFEQTVAIGQRVAVGGDIAACARPAEVLDLGCGTGFLSHRLAPAHRVYGLDLAQEMVSAAAADASPAAENPITWLCGDAENLPLADASVDAVLSSLTIQWCDDPVALASELERVLRPGGRAWIATLGPDTLRELRTAWAAVDGFEHVNPFTDSKALRRAFGQAGLDIVDWREEIQRREYDSVTALMRELKALGAHNLNRGRAPGLTGRGRLRQLETAYPRLGAGPCPASYEIWRIQLQRPRGRHG